MSQKIINFKGSHKHRVTSVDVTSLSVFDVATITTRVGDILNENSFELIITFPNIIRIDHSSSIPNCENGSFVEAIMGLNGFFQSKSSEYLNSYKERCDNYAESAVNLMTHYRIFGEESALDIISQSVPLYFKLKNDNMIPVKTAKDF